MIEPESTAQLWMMRFVLLLLLAFLLAGVVWHGISAGEYARTWQQLRDRPAGPMAIRVILQPMMAMLLAIRDGMKDGKSSRSPYLWTVLFNPTERAGRMREGLIATARIILLALLIDVVYQLVELGTLYPREAVIVAVVLAFVPYVVVRGPVARVTRWWSIRGSAPWSRT